MSYYHQKTNYTEKVSPLEVNLGDSLYMQSNL